MLRPARPRIAGLDLLRGLAVVLVMAHHALERLLPGAGVVGVVMFFTLSGYLITGVLRAELRATGTLDLRRFYRRRARRLVPALLVMLAGLTIVTLLLDPLHDRGQLPRTLLFALTWTGDLPFGHASPATFHLWTLALEEQFYLVWPALLLWCHRRGRLRLALTIATTATIAACVATTAWFHRAPDAAYSLPTSWALCFVVGAALSLTGGALVARRGHARAALVGLLVLGVVPLRGHLLTYLVGGPLIAALTAVLLVAWRSRVTVPRALGPLVAIGTVSYAAYLWDYPLTLWLSPAPAGAVLAAASTLLAAALSWRWVERPRQSSAAREVAVS